MNKTILVIGEVTRDQYQLARLELLREGHKPRIVRLGNEDIAKLQGRATELYYMGYEPSKAFREALEVVGVDAKSVDAVVYTAPSPDHTPDFLIMETDEDNGFGGYVTANLEDVFYRAQGVWV